MEPLSTDIRLILAPLYNGKFRLSRRKAHLFFRTSDIFLSPRPESHVQIPNQFVNPAEWSLFICELNMTDLLVKL